MSGLFITFCIGNIIRHCYGGFVFGIFWVALYVKYEVADIALDDVLAAQPSIGVG